MKIKKMTASFGVLDKDSLELKDGLNIIRLPNESGKSTWCAFIRAMLYGVDNSERERAGFKPDKVKYLPWNGSLMQGVMDIEYAGGEITLRRLSKSDKLPFRDFAATYTGTGDPVFGLDGINAGEEILGIPRSVFERSCFIGQSALAVTPGPDLERRIAAIVSTGEEDTSYTEADEKLRLRQRRRKFNKFGRIPEVEEEHRQIKEKLRILAEAADERSLLRDKSDRANTIRDEAKKTLEDCMSGKFDEIRLKMSDIRESISEYEKELKCAEENRDELQAMLLKSVFYGRAPEDAGLEASADISAAEAAEKTAARKIPAYFWMVPLVICAVSSILGYFTSLPLYPVGAAGALIAVVMSAASLALSKKAGKAAALKAELLNKYNVRDCKQILDSLEEYKRTYDLWVNAGEVCKAVKTKLKEAEISRFTVENELLEGFDRNSPEAVSAKRKLAEAEASLSAVCEELAASEGRCKATGDPMVLESEIGCIESKLKELTFQYDALDLAINTLREANEEMQNRFSPLLGQRATALLRRITDGKYDELVFDRAYNAAARRSGDVAARDSLFLSEGTLGQIYLALRLAICELALPDKEICPVILDDSLSDSDDERRDRALELLDEISKTRQIILFTCHKY